MNFDNEKQVFEELDSRMQAKFKELRVSVDEMTYNIGQKLNCQEVERYCSEMNMDDVFQPFIQEFKELGQKLNEQKRRFIDFKEDLARLIEASEQKLMEIMKKKEELLDKKCGNIEKTYSKLSDYQTQLDKFEPLLEGLSSFCSKFQDFEKNFPGFSDSKISDMKEEIKGKSENYEKFVSVLDEMKETQEHFTSKLDLIWQKFSHLQEIVHTSHSDFFKQFESLQRNPQKELPKLKTPIKENPDTIPKSPFDRVIEREIMKSPLSKPLDFNNIKVQEYLSPESFRNNKDYKITSSPVISLNINAFTVGKSPLGAEIRALVNQNKIQGNNGDIDNLNGRFSSIGKARGFSTNYERLSDMGFKSCEETGFQINEEGLVLGVDGNVILDSEGNPIKLLPEYVDFLSQNIYKT